MSNQGFTDVIECDTVQIIEPNTDLLVDVAGANSDMDERGDLVLDQGQTNAIVRFAVTKLSTDYRFEYLYVSSPGQASAGSVQVVPVTSFIDRFVVAFAGAPIAQNYVLHWRVVIHRTSTLIDVDAPESQYLQMPRTNTMAVLFHNPRSGTDYGFSELRVENLVDPHPNQAVIHVQVYLKSTAGFSMAVNPRPPTDNYFLQVRTP